ncbi:MAG: hypothetical protein GWO16_03205, partial [Gammaproteobacteria bacterium]|nr:hypothetical protein [Gammaproteobacteria bacterium]
RCIGMELHPDHVARAEAALAALEREGDAPEPPAQLELAPAGDAAD